MTTTNETADDTVPTDLADVRELRATDLSAIVKIDRASTGSQRREYYETKVRAALAEPKLRTSLVAEVDGHVVGFLLARLYYGEFGRAEPVAVIDSLGVNPDHRGREVGWALMHQLLMNLDALRVERVGAGTSFTSSPQVNPVPGRADAPPAGTYRRGRSSLQV